MQKVFVDTDVALDLLSGRLPHYEYAARLFTLADKRIVRLFISALSFSNLNYVLRRARSANDVRKILVDFRILVNVLAVDDKIIQLALQAEFNDFEDAIQHFTAIENHVPVLLTRNIRDYRKSSLPVSTPEQFLKTL